MMGSTPLAGNFRIAVESVILYNDKVLLVKRSPTAAVAPGVWNVPAGKVKPLEVTEDAVVRETLEETSIEVKVVRLIKESAFNINVHNETHFRNMFTYLVMPSQSNPVVKLNDEHTEWTWASEEDLKDPRYSTLHPRLRDCIKKVLTTSTVKTV